MSLELAQDPDCTCGVGDNQGIVHEGDCPERCTWYMRDYHSDAIAQCALSPGHEGGHVPNLYRGSPSRRAEQGRVWPVPDPVDTEPARTPQTPCPFYLLTPDRACRLARGHREPHVPRESS